MLDIAISVRGLSKAYTIRHQQPEQHSTLSEQILSRLRSPFSSFRPPMETFWALKDVSFDIPKGEVVGVVGRNGAGKSTLLKVLSQITEPTKGAIDLYGRVGSLLEVGTGFHPELTGRENIYLNGQILGMRRGEIERQFDEIVAFAGVEQFLDTPVKRYSSGMYVRLAFAVAAHLQSEILIVDEVLAVGDAEFQGKCMGKMKDVANSGRTVLFVSHHMQSVQLLCGQAMYLEQGQITHLGSVAGAIERYSASFRRASGVASDPDRRQGSGELRFTHVAPAKNAFTCGEEKIVHFTITRRRQFTSKFFLSAHVIDEAGVLVAQCDSRLTGFWLDVQEQQRGHFVLRTPWLKPGRYRLDMFICCNGVLDYLGAACFLDVLPMLPYSAPGNDEATQEGVVFGDFGWTLVDFVKPQ